MADPIDEFIALPQSQQMTTLQQLAPDKQDALLAQVKQRKGAGSGTQQSKPVPNPWGEGTYKMTGPNGASLVPYSLVPTYQNSGFAVSSDDASRYKKDHAPDTHPVRDWFDTKFANNPGAGQPGGYSEVLRPVGNIGRRAVRDVADTASSLEDTLLPTDPMRAGREQFSNSIMGQALQGNSTPAADIIANQFDQVIPGLPLGSRPLEAVRTARTQGPMQAATDAAGDALAIYGSGKAIQGASAVPAIIPRIVRGGLDILAGTEPVAGQLVDKTGMANNDAIASAVKATQANAEKAAAQTATNQERATNANTARAVKHQTQVQSALEKTRADQATAQAQQAVYEKQVQDHAAAVAKADEINKAAAEDQTLRGQLARKSVQLAQRMVERVRQVAANTKAGLDQSYAEIRQATGQQIDPETGEVTQSAVTVPREQLAAAVEKAQTKLKGSNESIKQFKDILSKAPEDEEPDFIDTGNQGRIPKGHALYDAFLEMKNAEEGGSTVPPAEFGDLQGYYTELGDKLKGGNLLPDVYLAMRSLQTDIAAMMQKMAAERGVGAKLSATRARYSDYMQSFKESTGPNHSGSPLSQVLDAADPTYAVKPLTDPATAARVRTILSRFDPAVNGVGGAGQLYDNFRDTMNRYENTGKLKPAKPVGEPPTPPAAAPEPAFIPDRPQTVQPEIVQGKVVQPDITKIGPEDIQQAKSAQVGKGAQAVRTQATRVGLRSALYGLPANLVLALTGHPLAAGAELGLPASIITGGRMLANVLDHPAVTNWLSNPTAADLEQLRRLPPEQRTVTAQQLEPLIKAARARGIQVNPAITALMGTAQPIANQFPAAHPLAASQPQ